MSSTASVEIEILPEGSIVHRHTSKLLDLKSRANVLDFMNIIVDETPIIPYEVYRRYISGRNPVQCGYPRCRVELYRVVKLNFTQ